MDLVFADDSRQRHPSRNGMGPLLAIGGLYVPGESVRKLERSIDEFCAEAGFPAGTIFKWSPGAQDWMRDNLRDDARQAFFNNLINMAALAGAIAVVVIEDVDRQRATNAASDEVDVTALFLERAEHMFRRKNQDGLVIVDRPGGNRGNEEKFLASCLETIQSGTTYVKPERIALNVVSTPSKLIRLLQVADVITSCVTSFVSGEDRFSPGVFPAIKRILDSEQDRIGGVGVKIHPDFRYANLYHWLFGDTYLVSGNTPLPTPTRHYFQGPNHL